MASNAGPVILPQFQGDYLDVQRKQALAQALMGMSLQNQGTALNQTGAGMRVMPTLSPLAGIAQLGTALLAAKTGNDANQGMRDLGQQQMNFLMGSPGQQQDAPGPVAQQPQTPGSFGLGAGGGFTDGGVDAGTSTLASALAQARQQQGASGGFLAPGSQNNPAGLPTPMAAQMYLSDPGEYWKTQAQQFKPADIVAQLRAAGVDPSSPLGRQMAQQAVAKTLAPDYVSGRPGGYMTNKTTGETVQLPHVPDGFTALQDPNGQWHVVPVEGAVNALQQSSQAQAAGKAAVTPVTGYQNGAPVFTNALNASQGGAGGGNGAPVNTGRFGGYTPPGGSGPITPGLAPGVEKAAVGMAEKGTGRANTLIDAAGESPTRVNVLDNILSLSQAGVGTGPTAEWKNKIKGALADTVGPDSWKDDVTGFQEMKKFLKQNGLRAWQAAGGSGTDSQLSAAMEANPNDKMFPQAVQTMAKWAKAGELALQSKASAQDTWLARNGNNPAAQNQFESAWRQNFDPRIYQMKMMSPTELQAFTGKLSPADRNTLLQKYSTAKQNGWIQ